MLDLLPHLLPYTLATFRLAGTFIAAPLLGGSAIPPQARALLVFALGAAMYPALPALAPDATIPDTFTLGVAVIAETLIGLSIGLMMMMPVAAVQLAGHLMGHQMGFGLAQIYNPALDADTDILGDLLGYIAIGVFLAIGGLESLFVAVARTFDAAPPGLAWSAGLAPAPPADLLAALLGSGFELAVRVSLPLMGIITIETVALALLTKTVPQANIMSIGFAIKILLGFAAIIAGLTAGHTAIADHVSDGAHAVLTWAATLGGGSTP